MVLLAQARDAEPTAFAASGGDVVNFTRSKGIEHAPADYAPYPRDPIDVAPFGGVHASSFAD